MGAEAEEARGATTKQSRPQAAETDRAVAENDMPTEREEETDRQTIVDLFHDDEGETESQCSNNSDTVDSCCTCTRHTWYT